jgi:hypothetical protein
LESFEGSSIPAFLHAQVLFIEKDKGRVEDNRDDKGQYVALFLLLRDGRHDQSMGFKFLFGL